MAGSNRAERLSDEQLARLIGLGAEDDGLAPGAAAPDAETAVTAGPEVPTPEAGQTWGKFLIEKSLGRGGQAVVCQAYDRLGPAGHVAFKIPCCHVPASRVEEWIRDEAEPLGRLDHPSIVRVVDVGAVDGVPYVATELIDGLPLNDHVQRAPPSDRQVLDWAIQLAEALDCAHACGVVHRDLKPANVMIARDGRPLIIDFGISSLVSAYQPARPPDASGTPAFMAPEQARPDGQADHRADVFALGGVLKFLLTGAGPYGEGQVWRDGPALEFEYEVIAHRAAPAGGVEKLLVGEGSKLRSGEQYRVRFRPEEDCFLYLFTYDAAGSVYALFPHPQVRRGNRVRAGAAAVIPGQDDPWFTLDDKVGSETLILLASREPLADPRGIAERMERAARGDAERGTVLARRRREDGRSLQAVLRVAKGNSRAVKHVSFRHVPAEGR